MANENAQLAEFAENLWKNYLRQKYHDESKDVISFYRAEVVSNDGSNRLTIKRPYDNSYQVSCTDGMSSATAGMQVIVVRLGNGVNNKNHLVIAKGNGSPIDGGGGGGGGGTITVDSALSTTSTNPVQNKVITNALNNKADASTAVTNVAYDSTNQKITKTINGTTSDVVTVSTLKTAIGTATTSANGLMSSSDKSKLNDIESGAEVNQHAFSSITPYTIPSGQASQWTDTTGSLTASTKTDDALLIAGDNITITKRYNSSEDITGLQISATGGSSSSDNVYYGTLTAFDTATKTATVTCSGFTKSTGAIIVVDGRVDDSFSMYQARMNVNNTGADLIKYRTESPDRYFQNYSTYAFAYDGSAWDLIGLFPDKGTSADLQSGVGTFEALWSPKTLHDYIVSQGGGGGGGDYILTYEESNAVGSAIVGTAKTGEPNYIPSGDIAYTTETVEMFGAIDYSVNNNVLTINGISGMTRKPVVTSVDEFIGSGVTFIIVSQ